MHAQLGLIQSEKIQKDQKTQLSLLESWEQNRVSEAKARYCTCPVHSAPLTKWSKHLSHCSSPILGHRLTLILCKKPANLRFIIKDERNKLLKSNCFIKEDTIASLPSS